MNLGSFLVEQTEEEVKEWMTSGFAEGDFGPISFDPIPSIPVQIQRVFLTLRTAVQEKVRRVVVRATGEWMSGSPFHLLEHLCYMAAYTKASRVAPVLRTIITNKLIERQNEDAVAKLIAVAIATIAGFSPLPDAIAAIEPLYFEERLHPRYAAQLLFGLVRADGTRYPNYLPRFARFAIEHPKLYRIDLVLNRLIEEVTLTVFAREFRRLDPQTAVYMDFLLPEANVIWDAAHSELVYTQPGKSQISVKQHVEPEAMQAIVDAKRLQMNQQDFSSFLGLPN